MGDWLDWFGGVLFDAGLSATLLLSLVALGLVGCRQPVRRVHVARLALLCSIVLLPFAEISPLPRVSLMSLVRSAIGEADALPVPLDDRASSDEVPATTELPRPWWQLDRVLRAMPKPARVLVPIYLACVTVGAGWLFLGYWGLGWLSRGSRAPSSDTLAFYDALEWEGRCARPRLRLSDRVSRPVLVGVLRPLILIPDALDRSDDPTPLRLSLLHELAHAESCDPLFNLIGRLAQVCWFFLPPTWWIRAQLVLDHEFLADRRAAAKFGHLPAYASSLLGMTLPTPSTGAQPKAGTHAAALPGSALVQRMLMLVRCPFPVEARPPARWVWSLSIIMVLATLVLSTLRVRVPETTTNAAEISLNGPLAPHTFRLSRLTVPSRPAHPRGRAPLFELPVRLPDSFNLTIHVWGTPASLANTRVIGLCLASPRERLSPFAAPPSWHLVHIQRDKANGPVTLEVDDRPIPADVERGAVTTWLSVEPSPNIEGQFQYLKLDW